MKEHQQAVNKNDPLSHIAKHRRETGHTMDIDNPAILYNEKNLNRRLFLESWATNDNTINRCRELNDIYSALK